MLVQKSVASQFEPENAKLLGDFATFVAQVKHDKAQLESMDAQRPLQILGNICARVFRHAGFGFFEHLRSRNFPNASLGNIVFPKGNHLSSRRGPQNSPR